MKHLYVVLAISYLLIVGLLLMLEYNRTSINESFSNENTTIPRVIYMFWTGSNPMTENRKLAIQSMKNKSGCDVVIVTKDNLKSYILKEYPLHPAYEYLSDVHKSDYLRTYFMHFYGGGYSDIKMTTGDWNKAFDDISNNPHIIANGYQEVGPHGVGYEPHKDNWRSLIGNGAYIFRPMTECTHAWYSGMIKLLDSRLEELKKHPATHPRDKKEDGTGYPIRWIEMLGEIFHKVTLQYADRMLMTVPIPIFYNYM